METIQEVDDQATRFADLPKSVTKRINEPEDEYNSPNQFKVNPQVISAHRSSLH